MKILIFGSMEIQNHCPIQYSRNPCLITIAGLHDRAETFTQFFFIAAFIRDLVTAPVMDQGGVILGQKIQPFPAFRIFVEDLNLMDYLVCVWVGYWPDYNFGDLEKKTPESESVS